MINPIDGREQKDLSDLLKTDGSKTVCKVCFKVVGSFYSTDNGYVCKAHSR